LAAPALDIVPAVPLAQLPPPNIPHLHELTMDITQEVLHFQNLPILPNYTNYSFSSDHNNSHNIKSSSYSIKKC